MGIKEWLWTFSMPPKINLLWLSILMKRRVNGILGTLITWTTGLGFNYRSLRKCFGRLRYILMANEMLLNMKTGAKGRRCLAKIEVLVSATTPVLIGVNMDSAPNVENAIEQRTTNYVSNNSRLDERRERDLVAQQLEVAEAGPRQF
jgi:hypothetical protein